MSNVRIHMADDLEWKEMRALGAEEHFPGFMTDGELESRLVYHERGDENEMQMMEQVYVPGAVVNVHAHDQDQIKYVISGELHFGDQVLGPGSSLFIRGKSFYGFRAGPDGLRLIDVRPRADYSLYPKGSRPSDAG